MPDLSSWIAAAREAVAKATPGPWQEGGPWPSISVIYESEPGYYGPNGGEPPEYDAICSIWQGVDHTGRMVPEHPDRARHLADARAIVLAVNSLPALLDVAEAGAAVSRSVTMAQEREAKSALDSALSKLRGVRS